jgi:hypothetical protein
VRVSVINILRMFKKLNTYHRTIRTTITNTNEIHDEIRRRIKSENSCYYSARKLIVQCNLLSKTLKIRMYAQDNTLLLVCMAKSKTCES